jgi:uncharacterized protein YfaS (alpha-2-macroglobulin family)
VWLRDRVRLVFLALVPLWAGCGGAQELPDIGPQDPLWESVIERHSRGEISRRDRIRVVFAQDVVDEGRIGESAAEVLSVDPTIAGSVTFASRREIVVSPDTDLEPGSAYVVTLRPEALAATPAELDRYQFVVQVMEQGFEVDVTGLSPDPAGQSSLVLLGRVVTADVDDADRVERVVRATLGGESLELRWEHENDGRRHQFSVAGITRGDADEELTLAWDGDAIGVESAGERRVTVPAHSIFAVTRVDAVQEQRQYVLIQFSDPLDQRQNLSGLVSLGATNFTSGVEGNQIRLYPAEQVTGTLTVTVQPGVRSTDGKLLTALEQAAVTFAETKPGVRFAGDGNILPETERLTIPIEAVNVHSVQVAAFRVEEANMGQFLQRNPLGGSAELGRVGRYLWRRTLPLASPVVDQWNRYALDLTDVMRDQSGMIRLTLSINRGNSTYTCTEEENLVPVVEEAPLVDLDEYDYRASSNWDNIENTYGVSASLPFSERANPCRDAYYRWSSETKDSRNFISSNLGIVAKRDQLGSILVTTTDLRTSDPESGVDVTFMNFQDRPMATVTTDADGMARIELEGTPFYALAEKGDDRGYLKMSRGVALATSHFDVGGATVTGGLKGYVYGERGVWRPGDAMHLTFVVQDEEDELPDAHPATLQLFDPRGQRVHSITHTTPTNGFYSFEIATDESAPTGTWQAAVEVGGSRFTKSLKVETVVPNRLRVDLDFGGDERLQGGQPVGASLFGQWLSGAIARGLKADVEVRLLPSTTAFDRFTDYTFDDPARTFVGESQGLFEGELDQEGRATFQASIAPGGEAAGFMSASFTSRVFERGGAFSTNHRSVPFSPYTRYVGVRLPPGDAARGMLLTDTTHAVDIATVDADGAPVSVTGLQVTLYKIDWKWWWDKSGESLAQYASSQHRAAVETGEVSTTDGRGSWPLRIDYPAWGRYLLRVCDPRGGHCTGRVFYIDWPGWAGRPSEQAGIGANVLTLNADREEYTVGQVAQIELPEAEQGRALVTLENGSRILDARWVELADGRTRFEVPITEEMSPTTYVGVTLIQPHADRGNDRPLRLYGVIPMEVTDPGTRLTPVLQAADEWRPNRQVPVRVSEQAGRAMTYTLAVVDEGLLGLTSFVTPELHGHFYQKEALGVKTWDVFDHVVGAYGGALERLLALGGDDGAELGEVEPSRYPPVVRFMGPFELDAGAENEHRVDLPQYIGAVRVMVVAGQGGAYGSTDKSVFVREPLSLLATLPRVVGPEEEITLPVSLFAMTEDVRRATVRVETDDHFEVVGSESATVDFEAPGEKMTFLRLRVGSRLGTGRVLVSATSGEHNTSSEVFLTVRSSNPPTVRQARSEIAPGERWAPTLEAHGLPGTNRATLELTTLPPLNLERRLQYLIRYPHGCVEQVTSAVFPQLYLPGLIQLEPARRDEVEGNVRAAIDRLRGFQVPSGAFTYWPGGFVSGFDARNAWATNYVGHFLVEAERRGYYVPPEMKTDWLNYQRLTAQSWSADGESSAMDQAYRLYTLALAGRAEMGAMNRLRASSRLGYVASWYLAAAYGLAGLTDVARGVAAQAERQVPDYERPGWSFGSQLRDRAIRLGALVILGMDSEAEQLAGEISEALYSDDWHSTHAIAYSLMAMAEMYGVDASGGGFSFERSRAGGDFEVVRSETPLHSSDVTAAVEAAESLEILNVTDGTLYGSLVVEGVPAAGDEVASSSGLEIRVEYLDASGTALNVRRLTQGTDLEARITVTNRTPVSLENLALEHRVPAGWEILNPRMAGEELGTQLPFEYQDIRDDRVDTYFALDAGQAKTFTTLLNAAYLGTYYLPSVSAEAMYDATKHARTAGFTVQVTGPTR